MYIHNCIHYIMYGTIVILICTIMFNSMCIIIIAITVITIILGRRDHATRPTVAPEPRTRRSHASPKTYDSACSTRCKHEIYLAISS